MSSHSAVKVWPLTKLFLNGSTLAVQPVFDAGYAAARLRATIAISAFACSSVRPGFRRPITCIQREPRSSRSAVKANGTQNCTML